jgi:hypothetical protein
MSVVIYARRFTCDSCETAADITEPFTSPEGWCTFDGIQAGNLVHNIALCPTCAIAPFVSVMERIARKAEQSR